MLRLLPWLLIPYLAQQIAHELDRRPAAPRREEIAARWREVLGQDPEEDEERLVDAVVARLRERQAAPAGRPVSAWVLAAANLVPLAGVLLWDWPVLALLALFWMENVIVGLCFALRIVFADPGDLAAWVGKLILLPFFCFHYGFFAVFHGVFLFGFFGGDRYDVPGLDPLGPALAAARDYGLWLPLAVLAASHGFSFAWNYLYRGEFRRASVLHLMAKPYGRVVVLHLAIILGGFAASALGSPVWALLVLLALKIGLDWRAHVQEHSARA